MEMEYCISEDLSNHLFPDKNFNYLEKVIKTISTELLLGLKELHSNGIIHCNLKPSNVLIDEHGNVKICDFKKALHVNTMTIADIRRNKRGLSPCYTAPEIFTDEGTFSFKSDLWALGCIMYEMASGEVPFKDEILHGLIKKILNNEPNYNNKKFTAYSLDFQNVVKCLLQKDTNQRVSWGDIEKMPFWDFSNDTNNNNNNNSTYDNTHKHEAYSSKTYSHNTSQIKSSGNLPYNVSIKNTYSLSTTITNVYNKSLSNNNITIEHNEEEDDDYSTGSNAREKDVNNTDQEFNLHYNTNTTDINHDKVIPNKKHNFLELSILNISKVITHDKRVIQTTINDMAISVAKNTDIPNIQSIMIHTSDRIIKPIIGNKLIEASPPIPQYNINMFEFPVYSIDGVKELIMTEQIDIFDNFLLNIYKHMDQYISQEQYDYLLNILNYFETIILSKEVANNIINTSFVKLFISFMDVDNVDICIRSCSIIANLIRYVTSMQHSLDKFNLTTKLISFIKAQNIMLNKKAIATLGEYFFFVATQAEGDNTNDLNLLLDNNNNNNTSLHQWNISNESINALLYALNHNDEVVQFYALKTIENTVILTKVAKAYFASNEDFIARISEIYFDERYENIEIKTSALNTIAHIVKLESKLMNVFISKFKDETLGNVINKESPKNQQCIINIILFGIVVNVNNINTIDFDDVMPSFVNLLESANSVIRGKIILILSLVFGDKYFIYKYGEKVFNIMMKLRKDKQYYYYHIKIFESFMINFCKNILRYLILQITKSISTNTANTNNDIISLITAIAIIAPYYKISFSLFKTEFIEALVSLISSTTNEVIHSNALDILRCFSETAYSVEESSNVLITSLFASILNLTNIVATDSKRIPLNICANILTVLLDDDKLYSSASLENGKTNQINSLILSILPLMVRLLQNEDTVNDSLSFLSLIIERNCSFVTFYRSIGIIDYVFQLMVVDDNFISNLNLLKILTKLIEAKDTKFDTIVELSLIDKVNYLISKDNADDVSIYTEYVIEMLFELMYKLNEHKRKKYFNEWNENDNEEYKVHFLEKIENVVKNFNLCIKLFSCNNANVQEKCVVIVIFMLQFLPVNEHANEKWDVTFNSENVVDLLKGLESPCVKIYKKIIRIFKWIIEYQPNAQDILGPYKSYIRIYIEKIRDTSKDVDVVDVANRFLINDFKRISSIHNQP